jgi:hypothetical protein
MAQCSPLVRNFETVAWPAWDWRRYSWWRRRRPCAAWDRFDEMLHGKQYVRPSFELETQTFKVDELETGAERAGLRN